MQQNSIKVVADANDIHNQLAPVVHVQPTMMQSRMMRRGQSPQMHRSRPYSLHLFGNPNQ
jgi:hypothetical protein